MAVDFAKNLKQAEDAGLVGGGDYFKLKEGDNRIRLMTECLPHPGTYQGKPNFKWLCYVIDKRDGKAKPFFMPHSIYKQIAALQQSEDYAFYDVPMPYEVTINAKGAGTKDVVYTLLPARKETPVTALESQSFADLKPLSELQKKLKEKSAQQAGEPAPHDPEFDQRHSEPLTDEDIPF